MKDFFPLLFLVFVPAAAAWNGYYDPSECGRAPLAPGQFKMMGGEDAGYGEFPGAVAIFRGDGYTCTGSFISRRHVVSAAHCFLDTGPSYIESKCGSNVTCQHEALLEPNHYRSNRCKAAPFSKGKLMKTFKLYHDVSGCLHGEGCNRKRHEVQYKIVDVYMKYLEFGMHGCSGSDLAILTVDKDMDMRFGGYFCLPIFNQQFINTTDQQTVSVGWGYDPIQGLRRHGTLQKFPFGPMKAFHECAFHWGGTGHDMTCVQELKHHNLCRGDSGGPLLTRYGDQIYLLGVLSAGTACDVLLADANKSPSVSLYTRIDFHMTDVREAIGWVNENLDEVSNITF